MAELTPAQIEILMRLSSHGFVPAAFPLYTGSLGIRRGPFAALLEPAAAGLRVIGQACYMVNGHLSVCVEQDGRRWFVWKGQRVEATAELLDELKQFSRDLAEILHPVT